MGAPKDAYSNVLKSGQAAAAMEGRYTADGGEILSFRTPEPCCRLYVAIPTLPPDQKPITTRELMELFSKYGLLQVCARVSRQPCLNSNL